jgi:hypothetical protein
MHRLPSQGWETNKTGTRFEAEHKQRMLHTKSSKDEPEHNQLMLHTKSSKDDESSGDGIVVGSSKLIRSKKNMRRRQLVPTYNASTPFTRLQNKQD